MSRPVDALAAIRQAAMDARLAHQNVSAERLADACAAVAELLAADLEYDAAKDALFDAKREKGNWRVNPLGHNHPAVVRVRAAVDRRRDALAKFTAAGHSHPHPAAPDCHCVSCRPLERPCGCAGCASLAKSGGAA